MKYLLLASFLFLPACVHLFYLNEPPQVVIATHSDFIPPELNNRIISDTNKFCREADRSGVKRIFMFRNKKENVTVVAYLCFGEISKIGEKGKPGQIRVTEIDTDYGIIVYKTFLANGLGY